MIRFFPVAIFLSMLLAATGARAETRGAPLRLGIYPLIETSKVMKMFSPLALYLERRTGRKVVVEAAATYKEHIDRTGVDGYEISYMGPVSYVRMKQRYGPKPILAGIETKGRTKYRGAIVVRTDSPIASLKELRGRRFAFGDKGSTMGYMVPRHILRKVGITLRDLGGIEFLSNQEDVALAVLSGLADAGAMREQVFEMYAGRGLKAVAWSSPLPEHLFVASSKLDAATRKAVQKALLAIAGTSEGPGILRNFQRSATGLAPVDERDYLEYMKVVRNLDALEELK